MAHAQADTLKPVFDSAVSILEVLSEDSQRKVLNFSLGLLEGDEDNPYRFKTESEFIESIDRAIKQADDGEGQDALDALEEVADELEKVGIYA